MSKTVKYDYDVTTRISIAVPIGTDPYFDGHIERLKERMCGDMRDEIEFEFACVFDEETGEYYDKTDDPILFRIREHESKSDD